MANNKKPNHRSGPQGPARQAITERNRSRRRKKWLKKQAKLKAKRSLFGEVIKTYHKKKNPGPNNMGHEDRSRHTIRIRDENGVSKLIEGLTISGCHPEGFNTLKEGDASIHFVTKAGKPFSPRLREFSWVIPAKVA